MNGARRIFRRLMRAVLWGAGGLALAALLVGGGLWLSAVRALPAISGTLTLAGLGAPVTIARDRNGIPLITAASDDDAYFALGYVHAQDRLFEMEMMRRQGQGRLSEIVGSLAVGADRFMRTLGVYRRAEADLRILDPAVQRAFDRYADGVNAWLRENHPLPLEFIVLGFKPEPWRPADSLVWQKLMGLELSGNWDEELFEAAVVAKLGPARAGALSPGPSKDDAVTISRAAERYDDLHPAALRAAMTAVIQPILASNVWTIAGGRTVTGKPILANDPHLGFQTPSIWYFAGIETPTLKIFGATVPGVPLHMLGHTASLAWGLTTTHSDTSDLFIEQTSADGASYQTPDGPQPFVTRTETIKVRFGKPVTVTVRETRHGPVVSDILPHQPGAEAAQGAGRVLALSAALLQPEDRTAEAVYRMNRATTADSFVEALKMFDAPQQNIMFADTDGRVGYYAPGRVPIRKNGDGSVPAPGWSGDYDWTGWIPFDALPHDIDPAKGFLVNANNKMVPDGYPYLIAAHWMDAYRANRITQLVEHQPASVETTETVQQDVTSAMALDLLPLLVAHSGAVTGDARALLDQLAKWNGKTDRERWEPLVFAVWMEHVKSRMFADELGDLYRQFGGARPDAIRNVLTVDPSWCDDVTTPEVETCDQVVAAAWSDALAWLKQNHLTDARALHWGDFHIAFFGHIFFQNLPWASRLGALTIPTGGDTYTVNSGTFAPSTSRVPFRHFHGSSLRAIYDLADLDRSQFALPGGESGQMASAHYGDLLQGWRDGGYFTAPTPATAASRLVLQPPHDPGARNTAK